MVYIYINKSFLEYKVEEYIYIKTPVIRNILDQNFKVSWFNNINLSIYILVQYYNNLYY